MFRWEPACRTFIDVRDHVIDLTASLVIVDELIAVRARNLKPYDTQVFMTQCATVAKLEDRRALAQVARQRSPAHLTDNATFVSLIEIPSAGLVLLVSPWICAMDGLTRLQVVRCLEMSPQVTEGPEGTIRTEKLSRKRCRPSMED